MLWNLYVENQIQWTTEILVIFAPNTFSDWVINLYNDQKTEHKACSHCMLVNLATFFQYIKKQTQKGYRNIVDPCLLQKKL